MSSSRVFPQRRFAPPSGATVILLARHGASAAFVEGEPFPMHEGQGDPPLSEEGREQAERLAVRLAGLDLTRVYVTTLRRTHETAAPLLSRTGLPVVVEPDLREVHLGDWDGGEYRRRIADGDPLIRRSFQEGRWSVLPNAEDDAAFADRVQRGLQRIADANRGSAVVAFVHGGVIAAAFAGVTGAGAFAFLGADNASLSELWALPDRFVARRFNDTTHLDDLGWTAALTGSEVSATER